MQGYEALRTNAAVLDLSARGKHRLTGEDRARLLHAMSTQDLNHLGENSGLYAFFLNAQGRILADSSIYNLGESLWLDTEPDIGPKLAAHLDKFIIADDVSIEDGTTTYTSLSIEGPGFVSAVQALQLPLPSSPLAIKPWKSGFVVRQGSCTPDGLRLFVQVEEREALWNSLHLLPLATAEAAEVVRLESGIPRYGADLSERYLVQETGLLRAVHNNKGCYLGQEIVERVRSRGQVHRHLTHLHIAADAAPEPGMKILLNNKEAGEITSARFSPALACVVAFSYLRSEATTGKPELRVNGALARAA